MPVLSKELEDVIALLPEGERAARRKLIEDAITAEQAKATTEIQKTQAERERLKTWFAEEQPKNQKLTTLLKTEREAHEREITELRKKVSTAAAAVTSATGENVDEAALMANIQARLSTMGVLTKEEVNAVIQEELKKGMGPVVTAEVQKHITNWNTVEFPKYLKYATDLNNVQFAHQAETGQPLDRQAFTQFQKDHNINDVQEAYDRFMAPTREAKRIKTEVDKQVAEKEKELRQKMAPFPGSTPTAGVPGVDVGHVQLRMHNASKEDPLFSNTSQLGGGGRAQAAAQELISEGKI